MSEGNAAAPRSLQARFAFTLVGNALRTALSFVTGILLARGLGPDHYGEFTFLLASFLALRQLLDMGTSTAFYTFMSQRPRSAQFVSAYLAWQLVQFVIPAAAIGLLFPRAWIDVIWIGHDRGIVLLAFAAAFLQQNAWYTVTQIGDSRRLTHRVQLANLGITAVHLALIVALWTLDRITVPIVFTLIVIEYLIGLPLGLKLVAAQRTENVEAFSAKRMLREFTEYCRPLVFYTWLGFAYTFADTWLLRKFGGPVEQGFYAISNQIAVVCLLAATAMIQIFWKEIAEAHREEDSARAAALYRKVSRFVFGAGMALCGIVLPWAPELTHVMLGAAFAGSTVPLTLMLLYHVYGSLGQIMGVVFFATHHVRTQVVIGAVFMLVSIPTSYFVQAPPDAAIPGLALGATGMAAKLLVLVIINVNVMGWCIAKMYGRPLDWVFQPVAVGGALLLGFLSVTLARGAAETLALPLVVAVGLSLTLYAGVAAAVLWAAPGVIGMTRADFRLFVERVRRVAGRGAGWGAR